MIPQGVVGVEAELQAQPSRTYKLDYRGGRIRGYTDGLEAMEQAIYKIVHTVRFEHAIYSADYGFEPAIGMSSLFARIELERRIREALLQDRRIVAVEQFQFSGTGDSARVDFVVQTVFGSLEAGREVNLNV